jgi:hypothetical protein
MPPTVYRPPQKPVAPAGAKKMNTQLIGLIAAGVVAVIGLGLTGVMWSGKSAAQSTVAQFKDSASALGSALGVSLSADTNTPIDWNTAWATLDKAAADQKKALADAQAQGLVLNQQVTDLQAAADELTILKPKADQQAALLKKTTDELEALKTSSAEQVAALQQELEGAKQALADAQAAAEAAAAQATTAPVADAGASPAMTEAAPDTVTPPADAATDAPVVAPAGDTGAEVSEAGPDEEVPQNGQFIFPEENSTLKDVTYDGAGKILTVTLKNDTKLVYRGVPPELYDGLVGAPVHEVYFRMKLVGNFPVTPDDKAALRELRYR